VTGTLEGADWVQQVFFNCSQQEWSSGHSGTAKTMEAALSQMASIRIIKVFTVFVCIVFLELESPMAIIRSSSEKGTEKIQFFFTQVRFEKPTGSGQIRNLVSD